MIERSKTLQLMDHLESIVMKRGWPIPFSPWYLVNHKKLLAALDMLRASLQDEADERFLQVFRDQQLLQKQQEALTEQQQRYSAKKER